MILNVLGYVNRALYLMPHFFKDKPVERLLGENIEAGHLNDDTLGRALDVIYAYAGNVVRPTGSPIGPSAWGYLVKLDT